ncbi:MAG TPA: guanylate kinase [Bacteroidales bacterium]|nr:guanylate kinase [Bacteroidales bacterium]
MSKDKNKGKLIIVSAPSGAGKTSIVKYILKNEPSIKFSVSATSRSPRKGEENGVDYYFMSADEFRNKIKNKLFVEWEEVYNGTYYGTLRSDIYRIWDNNYHIIFDVDVKGGINLKNEFGDKAIAIFIQPPGIDELRKRLVKRETEHTDDIERRVKKAREEMAKAVNFDKIIINNDLEKACSEALEVCKHFINNN